MSDTLLVFCTSPNQVTAQGLADYLVEAKLAACVTILSHATSVYRWQGKTEHADEYLLLIKTTATRYAALEQAITSCHPYAVPEIIAVPIQHGLAAYLDWVEQCTTIC